jgi:hypothetical protein
MRTSDTDVMVQMGAVAAEFQVAEAIAAFAARNPHLTAKQLETKIRENIRNANAGQLAKSFEAPKRVA